MLGPKQEAQAALVYEFSLQGQVPQDHLLRSTDWFVDLHNIRGHLVDFCSHNRAGFVEAITAYQNVIKDLRKSANGSEYKLAAREKIA